MKRKVELKDCGRASRKTKGAFYFLMFENASPPWDRLYFVL